MEKFRFFGLIAILPILTISCANRSKTASNSPYQSNPYYTNTGSATPSSSTGASQYPSYQEPNYSAANTPPVPSYTGGTYNEPSYTGSNPYSASNSQGSAPSYSPSAPAYTPAPASSGEGTTHVVATGENLYRISLKYGTTVSAIQAANGMTSTTIRPGQVLRIP